MVVIARRRQAEQRLQQAMDAGGVKQVLPAHHVGDALRGVVDHHRQMIAGRRLLARQDDVAPGGRIGGDDAGFAAGPAPVSSQVSAPARAIAACISSRSA